MDQKTRQGTDTMQTTLDLKDSEASRARGQARPGAASTRIADDLIPYSAKDLKYMWSMWDEAHRHRAASLRYRNIYAGALAVILAGWLSYRTGAWFAAPLGGILMLTGALIGAWYCLKVLRQKSHSPREG
jgi:hypothetical protein